MNTNKNRGILALGLGMLLLLGAAPAPAQSAAPMKYKVAIVVSNYPDQKHGSTIILDKVYRYAMNLKKAGVDVVLLFDWSGDKWLSQMLTSNDQADKEKLPMKENELWEPPDPAHDHIREIGQSLQKAGIPLMTTPFRTNKKNWDGGELQKRGARFAKADDAGRLDIAAYVLDGYQVWIF